MSSYLYRDGSPGQHLRKLHALSRKLRSDVSKLSGYAISNDDLGSLLSLKMVVEDIIEMLGAEIDYSIDDKPPLF